MLNKETYAILKKEIETNELNENYLKDLNEDLSRVLIHLYIKENYPEIQTEISNGKRFKKLLLKMVHDKISYYIGMFSNTLSLFDLLISHTKSESLFQERMIALYTKANVRKVVEFLLMHPDSQHKVIAQNIDIDKGYLSHILKELHEAGCVERYGTGKRSFFSLSVQGRDYVRKQKRFNRLAAYSLELSGDLFKYKYANTSSKNACYEDVIYPKYIYSISPESGIKGEIDPKEVEYAGVY